MEKGTLKDGVERVFGMPAKILEKGVSLADKKRKAFIAKKPFKFAEDYWKSLGPGLTAGAADDDPSGIATYSQAGARYGLQLI
jgi:hypothetical protein